MRFSAKTKQILGFYVYALVDPRNDRIFYVGKANANNRAFDHLKAKETETAKSRLISEIRQSKLQPRIEVLRYGMSSPVECLNVEAAVIDAIGLENLTNEVRGHGVDYGRLSAESVERLHGSKPVDVESLKEPLMLFFINQTFSPTLTEQELYDATRQFWHEVGVKTRTPQPPNGNFAYPTALAVADSVVVAAYSIAAWLPEGSTYSSRPSGRPSGRWEFVGQLIRDHPLLGRRLQRDGRDYPANQKGFGYVN